MKERRASVPKTTDGRSTRPFERRFADLSGQRSKVVGGSEYLPGIVDDY